MLNEVGGITKLANITKVSRQTYYDVLGDKQKDGPTWETILSMSKGIDRHRFAHLSFDLPEPEELSELDGKLKELCDLAMQMDDEQLTRVIGYVEGQLEGGDAKELGAEAEFG